MNKYHNIKTNGFDSKKEANRSHELGMLERAGKIDNLKRQVRFELIPAQEGERPVFFVADFTYFKDGALVVEDVKSPATREIPTYIIKRKLMKWIHNITIQEV